MGKYKPPPPEEDEEDRTPRKEATTVRLDVHGDPSSILDNHEDITDRFPGAPEGTQVVARVDLSRGSAVWAVDFVYIAKGTKPQSNFYTLTLTSNHDAKAMDLLLRFVRENYAEILEEVRKVEASFAKYAKRKVKK